MRGTTRLYVMMLVYFLLGVYYSTMYMFTGKYDLLMLMSCFLFIITSAITAYKCTKLLYHVQSKYRKVLMGLLFYALIAFFVIMNSMLFFAFLLE